MKEFTHALVRTVGEDGTARSVLLDMETASKLTQGKTTQLVSCGNDETNTSCFNSLFSCDLGGVKKALVQAERDGLLDESSSLSEIMGYLEKYQIQMKVDFGLPKFD